MQHKISIITPSYNQGQYIEQTIISVLEQNYPNLEYIIIDGGSSDNSVEIIKKYEKQLKYWISEKDNGQSHAINKGFKKATGDIIAWLNSDDIYLPDTLNIVNNIFNKNPDIDIIYGDVINFTEKKEEYYKVSEFKINDFLSRISIHQPAVFWRKKLLNNEGFLDESLYYTMDYDLWMRLFINYKSLKVNLPLAKFRMHNDSKTTSNPPELYLEYRKVISRFFFSFNEQSIIDKLKKFGIYNNVENKRYYFKSNFLFNPDFILIYLYQVALQEYTFGNYHNANNLFKRLLKTKYFVKALPFIIKNKIKNG